MTMPHLPVPVCLATPETHRSTPVSCRAIPTPTCSRRRRLRLRPAKASAWPPYAWGLLDSSSVLADCSRECIPHLVRKIPLSRLSLPSFHCHLRDDLHPGRDHERHRSHPRLEWAQAGAGPTSREDVQGWGLDECSPDDCVSGCRDHGHPLVDGGPNLSRTPLSHCPRRLEE